MQTLFFVVALAFCTLFAACGGGGGGGVAGNAASGTNLPAISTSGYPGQPLSCSVPDQRAWMNDYMADKYFWSANLAVPNAAASSLSTYFNSLLFVPIDRYSFTQDVAQFTQFFAEGTRTGFGYSMGFTDPSLTELRIRAVEAAGPAAAAGLKRGDTVLSINGLSLASIAKGELPSVNSSGVTRTFTVSDAPGASRQIAMVSRNFPLASVVIDKIFTGANNVKIGYLAYQEFTPSSLAALGAVFNRFREGGVTELVVDLRYNGGGSVQVARALASLIGGSSLDGKVFAKVRFNVQNADRNFDYPFTASLDSLPAAPLEGLKQVFFITSPGTASASELLINALEPFKQVIKIGATTFGKPFGFQPRSSCNTTYNAVNFETFNAVDFGRYTGGLPATCVVGDDLSKELGDPTERRTAAALEYIQTKSCPTINAAMQEKGAADQSNRARAAVNSIAGSNWSGPELGEVSAPAMVMD